MALLYANEGQFKGPIQRPIQRGRESLRPSHNSRTAKTPDAFESSNMDPLESGSNLYAYCGNAPTDATDPSGLQVEGLFEDLVAEALKTAMEGYHNRHGGSTLTEVSESQANAAVIDLIKVDMAAKCASAQKKTIPGNPPVNGGLISGTVSLETIGPGEALVNKIAFDAARATAGSLGFTTELVDAEIAEVTADSNHGKLTVPDHGRNIIVTVVSSQTSANPLLSLPGRRRARVHSLDFRVLHYL